jgi:hypothetical protein
MMQQQLLTNQASGQVGYLETTTGEELLLRQSKIRQLVKNFFSYNPKSNNW